MEERRYSSTNLTLALDVGELPASHPGSLTHAEISPLPIQYEAGWASVLALLLEVREKPLAPSGNQTTVP